MAQLGRRVDVVELQRLRAATPHATLTYKKLGTSPRNAQPLVLAVSIRVFKRHHYPLGKLA